MNIQLVTYNMGMGASRDGRPFFASKDVSFDTFCARFAEAYNAHPSSVWFLCLQEIDRDYHGNQVEELQAALERLTSGKWRKHSNTREKSSDEEAVAIFANVSLEKVQRYDLGHDRVGLAVKADMGGGRMAWVVCAHLLRGGDDPSGDIRIDETQQLLEAMVSYDANVPILFAADMNVVDTAPGTYGADEDPSPHLYDNTVGKLERFGFTRGFTPAPADFTVKAWSDPATNENWAIIDYLLVNTAGRCTTSPPFILNWKTDSGQYISDHKGVQMTINWS
ncbi:MAG TPA: hypothetical protein VHL59_16800 [Thermoanaerobaculia bacterium]|nr:hypothetical protein [Thermoanaerobaculia bacterium]